MCVLDNVEKAAIVHLVLEAAAAVYERAAARAPVELRRFWVGASVADPIALLGPEAPARQERLRELVGEAWDMLGALADRIVELTLAWGPQ
jgi:hypothetical protein